MTTTTYRKTELELYLSSLGQVIPLNRRSLQQTLSPRTLCHLRNRRPRKMLRTSWIYWLVRRCGLRSGTWTQDLRYGRSWRKRMKGRLPPVKLCMNNNLTIPYSERRIPCRNISHASPHWSPKSELSEALSQTSTTQDTCYEVCLANTTLSRSYVTPSVETLTQSRMSF